MGTNSPLPPSHSSGRVLIPIVFSGQSGDPLAAFVDKYLEDDERRAAVVAGPQMGKTTAALRIAGEMVRRQQTEFALVLTEAKALRDQPIQIGAAQGLRLMRSTAKLIIDEPAGFCLSTSRLDTSALSADLLKLGTQSSLFILVHEAQHTSLSAPAFVSQRNWELPQKA